MRIVLIIIIKPALRTNVYCLIIILVASRVTILVYMPFILFILKLLVVIDRLNFYLIFHFF